MNAMEGNVHASASTGDPGSGGLGHFFSDLVRCETRLYNALNDRLRSRCGIVTSQFEHLAYVRDHPGCRVADIAAFAAIGIGAASKGIDRLESRGWVRRAVNPADRRSSLLELTAPGQQLAAEAQEAFDEHLRDLVGPVLSPAQLRAVTDALGPLRAALEQAGTGTPVG
jgi:MarR family multiple antibiotic resistance transcriptional regulator